MILDLREFEEFPVEKIISVGPGKIELTAESIVRVDGVEVHLAVQKADQEYFCQGNIRAATILKCARCLGNFFSELTAKVVFVVCSEALVAERKGIIDDEDYVLFKGDNLRVDISEPVRQAILLAVPMKPLCTESCKGLCPQCGTNRNMNCCDCKTEPMDARWEGLKGLFRGHK